jgi:hypothetical protein
MGFFWGVDGDPIAGTMFFCVALQTPKTPEILFFKRSCVVPAIAIEQAWSN